MHAVTAIRSQGRFGRGQGQEYTEAYVVEYWRPGFAKWERWKNTQNKEVSWIISTKINDFPYFVLNYGLTILLLTIQNRCCQSK